MIDDARHDRFLRLFAQHQPAVYAVIRAMVFDRADAEDIMQETATVLWRKFDEYADGTRFDRWAAAVARNQVLYHYQKAARDRRRLTFSPQVVELIADTTEHDADWLDAARSALDGCVDKLDPADRDLIRRRYMGHESGKAIAESLGRSPSAVSRMLSRVHEALLRCIRSTMEADA